MFNVPVTFVSPCGGLENEESRRYIYHEFASNGAKHMVLTCQLMKKILIDETMIQDLSNQLRWEGLDFVDAHATYGELLDMNCPIKSYRPRMLEIHRREIEICAALGIKTLTIHIGNNGWMNEPEYLDLGYNRACIEDTISQLLPVAEANGVTVCIENIWFQTNTPEELLRYKELFPSENLGLCYDAGHANMMSCQPGMPRPLLTFWKEKNNIDAIPFDDHILEKMLPHVVNCHLHDNDVSWDQHYNIGMGTVNWQKIIPLLKSAPKLKCIQSEVDGRSKIIGIKDVVDKFNWLATL